MAETRGSKPRRQRLFVALDLPDKIRAGVAAWGRDELVDPVLKPVRPESLHVTLVFLGHREAAEVEAIADVVRETASEWVLSKLEDPIPMPGAGRPSMFALPAPSPATRVRSEGRGSRRPAAVARWPAELPKSLKQPFYGVRLTLYRSVLQPGGSRYVPLAQVELPRSGQQ
jgi:2'-5' RNA ligase